VKYQHYRVPTNFKEDKYIRAMDIRPTERAVVHHILVFVLDPNDPATRQIDEAGGGQLTGYVPGDDPTIFPAGMAKKIPAGASLVFQVHYTPIGKKLTDQSQLALYFADGPTEKLVETRGINNRSFAIPAGDPAYRVTASHRFKEEVTLLSLWPHMHLRGKAFRYTAAYPDGKTEVLLSVPTYDFGWQTGYALAEPKALAAGTTLRCEAWFDNSAGNVNNPDPSAEVRWGPQTRQEMMIGYIDYISAGGGSEEPARGAAVARLRERLRNRAAGGGGANPLMALLSGDLPPKERADRAFKLLDKDGDGLIQASEFPAPALFPRLDANGDGAVDRDEAIKAFEKLPRP
jgi:hypothetical protein